MPEASNEIVVDRPPEDVFAFFADPENDPQWRTGVLEIAKVSGDGVGAKYAQGVKGPGGRRIAADIEITEADPPRALAFRTVAGPVRPEGRYTLTPEGVSTRVRFELRVELKGPKRLMAPMVQRTMDAEVAQLSRAKSVLEGQ